MLTTTSGGSWLEIPIVLERVTLLRHGLRAMCHGLHGPQCLPKKVVFFLCCFFCVDCYGYDGMIHLIHLIIESSTCGLCFWV